MAIDEIFLAEPRGFCAGVDRAIEIVERALAKFGAPIYVRHEIVHNTYVVDDLKAKGAIFIEDLEAALRRFHTHGLADAVRAEDQRGAGRHVGQLFDEDGAFRFQVVDDIGVVHDLVAHIDGRAEARQRALDDLDRAVDAGAEAARLGQHDFLDGRSVHHSTPISCTSKVTGRPASG